MLLRKDLELNESSRIVLTNTNGAKPQRRIAWASEGTRRTLAALLRR